MTIAVRMVIALNMERPTIGVGAGGDGRLRGRSFLFVVLLVFQYISLRGFRLASLIFHQSSSLRKRSAEAGFEL